MKKVNVKGCKAGKKAYAVVGVLAAIGAVAAGGVALYKKFFAPKPEEEELEEELLEETEATEEAAEEATEETAAEPEEAEEAKEELEETPEEAETDAE